jgi:hypothetical protein
VRQATPSVHLHLIRRPFCIFGIFDPQPLYLLRSCSCGGFVVVINTMQTLSSDEMIRWRAPSCSPLISID